MQTQVAIPATKIISWRRCVGSSSNQRMMGNLSKKVRAILLLRGMTPAHLRQAAGISPATWSRIMSDKLPADRTIIRIAAALSVSPVYLRGGYHLPKHLTEDDILFFADYENIKYLKMIKECVDKGLSYDDIKKLIDIISSKRNDDDNI